MATNKKQAGQKFRKEYRVEKEALARLQNRHLRTALHLAVLRREFIRSSSTWFVARDRRV